MQAQEICLLASRIAKGGTGMVAIAGQFLNLVLEDLKLNRNLKVNRVTQALVVQSGTNGPFNLEADYLRTYDMFYPLQGPDGMTQFLVPITMEQYDAEFKATQTSNYPYEFATDLSTQAKTASSTTPVTGVTAVNVVSPGIGYTTLPALAFAPTGAAAAPLMSVDALNFFVVGVGYSVGDSLAPAGGVGTPAKFIVETIGGGGTITSTHIYNRGSYSVLPAAGAPLVGGTGTGAALGGAAADTTWFLTDATITTPGVYAAAPAVTASGGGASRQATMTASIGAVVPGVTGAGQFYIYPQSNGKITLTHRYMRNQPDLVAPQTSTDVPWFPFTQYLIHQTAALMMGVSGDEREATFLKEAEEMLRPHLIMEGDEQQTVRSVRLDPRRFKSNRGLRPTKVNSY